MATMADATYLALTLWKQ